MNLGERIYELRNEKNLSQGDLADALDVSRQSVSKWENNMAVPDLDKLIKLCDIFEISLDELTGREKIEKSVNSAINQKSAVEPNKIAGYVLLGTTILGAIITLVTAPPAIYLCLPLLICTIICFRVKKHTWFWCLLITYLLFELYLSMGIRANIMHISKIAFLVIMTMLNIFCIKDVPTLPKNKRMIILVISEFGVLLSLSIIGLLLYLNNNVIGFSIYQWIYCPAYVAFTASFVTSIYQIIGFIREAMRNKRT